MSTLSERYVVNCPYTRAREYLADSLGKLAAEKSEQRLTLNASLGQLPGELQKDVLVRYAPAVDPMHFDQPWGVSWRPEGGGPFPDFHGELTVRADESYHSAVLELAGTYVPPLGVPGRAFDALLGRRIAVATAQQLLASIGAGMIARFEAEERAKHETS